MIRNLESILGLPVLAKEGEIGKAYNILFDDRSWEVRYLVVESGSWMSRHKALIPALFAGKVDPVAGCIPVLLNQDQVANAPDVDAEQPVSRQQEIAMIRHYGWPSTWPDVPMMEPEPDSSPEGDPHLRSAREVASYSVEASDGSLGSIRDFAVDDRQWKILHLLVTPAQPMGDREIAVPVHAVSSVSWADRAVRLDQPKEHFLGAASLSGEA